MASQGKSRRGSSAANQPAKKAAPAPARRKRSRLNVDPEQSTRVMLIGAVVGILVLAVGIIGFGYWYSVIRPRSRTVLQVENVKVSYTAMKRRMAYELLQNTSYQQAPTALPDAVVQTLTNEIIIDLKAESDQGITVTADEFNQKLTSSLGVAPNADSKTFADALKKQLDATGLTDAEYRRMIRAQLLATKLNAKFTAAVPATAAQAKVDVIETQTEADAQKAAQRVKAGEDWATVAKSLSTESNVATTGGIHDYAPQGTFDPGFDAQAFSAKVGEVTGPIAAPNGNFFVIRVEDRADKPVTDAQKPQMAQKAFSDWITKMQGELTIKQNFDATSQGNALADVWSATLPKLKAQALQQLQQQQAQATAVAQSTPAAQATPGSATPVAAQTAPGAGQQSPAPGAPTPGGGNGQ